MNNEIQQAFLNALVARASYAELYKDSDTLAEVQKGQSKMTESMATYFATHFSVVDSALSSGDIDSGFRQYCLNIVIRRRCIWVGLDKLLVL